MPSTDITTDGTSNNLVVLYPSPGMGHLVSMIELGMLLIRHGLSVTIPTVKPPCNTGATAEFLAGISAANPSLSFHRLPPVTLSPGSKSPHHEALTFEVMKLSNPALLCFLHSTSPCALILDFFCTCALDVASELKIPCYIFCTSGASVLATFLQLPVLHKNSSNSFRELGYECLSIPGVPPIPANHMPLPMLDRDDRAYKEFLTMAERLPEYDGIIINTFTSLEPHVIECITSGKCVPPGGSTPLIYCIGPLIKSDEKHGGRECLSWLNKQPKSSVVFLCFGSIGTFSAKQIKEIAIGLEKSGHKFLWVVRSPPNPEKPFEKLPEPDLDMLLPEGFLERTSDRGFVAKSWAPQVEVLRHESLGGFVMHCGWNSVLEAVTAGVPMVAWPLYAEQWMNKVFLEEEMKLAVVVEGYNKELVAADEVERKIKWLMESDGGKELRERVAAVQVAASRTLVEGGESYTALVRLVNNFKKIN
ncbi:UDP-glycosyltransferase 88A1-like protein [Carex littledalei]|uniref:Glycosyltransferase n=1 Tax=Carex littledalei TaxID=544730 RepID=A0A833RJ57_9POAL|nr:UDP-glycosyltransferase 88A1-like protein [Carex littledalei]